MSMVLMITHGLQVCSVNVVKQFARVAQTTGFAYCYSILESNRRNEYNSAPDTTTTFPQNGQSSKAHSDGRLLLQAHAAQVQAHPLVIRDSAVEADLNTFFPFDPYKLPLSHSYIDGVYREWSSVALDDGEESGESDDDGEAPEDNEASSEGEAQNAEDGSEIGKGELAFGTPMVVNSLSASSSAEELGKSFGGMSISPLRRMEIGSYVALQA
jgi:RNA polymerase I-specific transcription initiation factor RRN3